jgi:hypothetical protein
MPIGCCALLQPQGATILGARPAKAMTENEVSVPQRNGGISVASSLPEDAVAKGNASLFRQLGADSVLIVYRNAQPPGTACMPARWTRPAWRRWPASDSTCVQSHARQSILGPVPSSSPLVPCARRAPPLRAHAGAVGAARRLHCDARTRVVPQNSLRSLRSLRSDSRGKSVHEARWRAPTLALRFSPPQKSPPADSACRDKHRWWPAGRTPTLIQQRRARAAGRACEAARSTGLVAARAARINN